MIQAFCVDSKDVQKERAKGLTYEQAVRKCAKPVQVEPGHQAYDSLDCDMAAVVDGVLYDLTMEKLES